MPTKNYKKSKVIVLDICHKHCIFYIFILIDHLCPDPLLTFQFSALLSASYDHRFVAVGSDAILDYLLIFGIGSPPEPGLRGLFLIKCVLRLNHQVIQF